jgi:hypothetical protein
MHCMLHLTLGSYHTNYKYCHKQDRRSRHNRGGSTEIDSQKDNSDTEKSDNPDSKPSRSKASSSK